MDFNVEIESFGLFLLLDLSLNVMIGGMILINCSGINVMCYGIMKDYVVSFIVVFVDGIVVKMRNCLRKMFVGYNLNILFIGFEGIFGIIIEVILKFVFILINFSVVMVIFDIVKGVVVVVV